MRRDSQLRKPFWLMIDTSFRLLAGFFVLGWMARYLGTDRFGVLSYSLAVFSLTQPLLSLGLNDIIVSRLVRSPEKRSELVGSALTLKFLGALLSIFICFCIAVFTVEEKPETFWPILLISLSALFQVFDGFDYYFQSHGLLKQSAIVRSSAFFLGFNLKILGIYFHFPLLFFIFVFVVEAFFQGGLFLYVSSNHKLLITKLRCSKLIMKELVESCWPIFLSGLFVMAYLRLDQILIEWMLGASMTGVYAAAVRLAEIWYFIPTALYTAILPALFGIDQRDRERFASVIRALLATTLWGSAIVVGILFLFAPPLIDFVFGGEFKLSVMPFRILILGGGLALSGILQGYYLVVYQIQRYSLVFTGMSGCLSIVLNFIFIPRLGVVGAAYALLITQIFNIVVFPLIFRDTREMGRMFLRGVFQPEIRGSIDLLRKLYLRKSWQKEV